MENDEGNPIPPPADAEANERGVQVAIEKQPSNTVSSLFWSVVLFFNPLYIQLKTSHTSITRMCDNMENAWKDWEQFFDQQPSFWAVSYDQFFEKASQYRQNVLDFLRTGRPAVKFLFPIWYQSRQILIDSLDDLQKLHDYIIPQPPGTMPFHEIPANKSSASLRELCFWMNMNLVHRLFLSSCQFLSHVLAFYSSRSLDQIEMPEVRQVEFENIRQVPMDEQVQGERRQEAQPEQPIRIEEPILKPVQPIHEQQPGEIVQPIPDQPQPADLVQPVPNQPQPVELVQPIPYQSQPVELVQPIPADQPQPAELVQPIPADQSQPADLVQPIPDQPQPAELARSIQQEHQHVQPARPIQEEQQPEVFHPIRILVEHFEQAQHIPIEEQVVEHVQQIQDEEDIAEPAVPIHDANQDVGPS